MFCCSLLFLTIMLLWLLILVIFLSILFVFICLSLLLYIELFLSHNLDNPNSARGYFGDKQIENSKDEERAWKSFWKMKIMRIILGCFRNVSGIIPGCFGDVAKNRLFQKARDFFRNWPFWSFGKFDGPGPNWAGLDQTGPDWTKVDEN